MPQSLSTVLIASLLVTAEAMLLPARATAADVDVQKPAIAKPPDANKPAADRPAAAAAKQIFRGQVVILREALKRRGIASNDEFDRQVVLETPDGELIPIVPDWRGRAFFQDERLRNRKVELVGSRRAGVPYLEVLMVFTFDEKGQRQYTDYWCDLCAIPMYELKPCDCCQGDIRLRFQPRDLPDYLK
jgi:hypothetical protein